MNVIFLDFDGVLNTVHYCSFIDIEKRIIILSEICKKYNCKVVIEASSKNLINEETLEVKKRTWVEEIFNLFKKHSIECIGRTPNKGKVFNNKNYSMWKEDEILAYLEGHPEIEHFCIIDDDDAKVFFQGTSDLEKLREYLVQPIFYSTNPDEEGLLPKHIEEVGEILKQTNKFHK